MCTLFRSSSRKNFGEESDERSFGQISTFRPSTWNDGAASMTKPFSEAALAALGLEGVSFGPRQALIVPESEIELGAGWRAHVVAAVSLTALAAAGKFIEARPSGADTLPIRVEVLEGNPSVMRFIVDPDSEPAFRVVHGGDDAIVRTAAGTVIVDLKKAGVACCQWPDGTGIGFDPDGYLYFHELHPLPPVVDVPASDVASWCADANDQWLISQVGERLEAGNAWEHSVAVGMYARLLRPSSGAAARERVQRVLKGEIDEPLARPTRWARSLTPEQLAFVEREALAEADGILLFIDELCEHIDPADPAWREDLLAWCHRRDDLEGVWLILREANAGKRLTAVMRTVDYLGHQFVSTIPARIVLPDERLWRAQCGDPDAWWSSLAEPETNDAGRSGSTA
jgi:hypothetical protein